MKKIAIIGHYGGGNNFTDGQTVKTKEISNYLEKFYNTIIDKYDTYNIKKKLIFLLFDIKKIIKNNDIIILIVSRRGYKILSSILVKLNKKYHKKIFDVVIGGTRFNLYDDNEFYKNIAMQFDSIFVETNNMVKEYNKRGLYNVKLLPNFKNIELFKVPKFTNKEQIKLCTFTRITYAKGIEDAIESVKLANSKYGKNVFQLDIYGKPDKDYEERFNKILDELPSNIKYMGMVNANDSSNTIKNYDYMLFLTFWYGEGFPGTIIDSFFANVPIIATDWNCNFEILEENYTGIKVKLHDIEEVSDLLIDIYNNQKKYYDMRSNCYKEALKYLPDNAMINLINKIDE